MLEGPALDEFALSRLSSDSGRAFPSTFIRYQVRVSPGRQLANVNHFVSLLKLTIYRVLIDGGPPSIM
jgi:hypothetical protein